MKSYVFDINVEAWIRRIEVEAENEEDAENTLYSMSLQELLEKGYLKNLDITDVEMEVEDEDEEDF